VQRGEEEYMKIDRENDVQHLRDLAG